MNNNERIKAVLQNKPIDQIPWIPRMDLWYRANQYNNTLPAPYQNASLDDILEAEEFGYHAVVPDFMDIRSEEDTIDRALGIYNLSCMPCQTVLEGIERSVQHEEDHTKVTYITPVGELGVCTRFDKSMRKAGITITHIDQYAFKSAADYEALTWLFNNTRVEANYNGYQNFADRIGTRGTAVGFISLAGSPMHQIQRELMPYDQFFYEQMDHPQELSALAEAIGQYWQQLIDTAIGSSADILFAGANYDASMTYPPFFEEHITPWIQELTQKAHDAGKYVLCHTDGENRGLVEHYLNAGFDIADSICPAPMTSMTMAEVKGALQDRMTIMGGIPSVALHPASMSDSDFNDFLDAFFKEIGKGDHLILGISDTTPPDADFDRLRRIRDRIVEFGGVG